MLKIFRKVSPIRKIKLGIIKISRTHSSVHEIAFGTAVGAFISIFPTFGLGTFIVLILYRWLKFNLLSAIAGSMISNFLTSPFFLAISYKIGTMFYGGTVEINFQNWYHQWDYIGISVLIGSTLLSAFVAGFLYVFMKIGLEYYRKKMKFSISQ